MLRRYHGMKKLRSFVTLRGPYNYSLPQKALDDLVSELKAIRVFSMSHCCITKVPDSIFELKRLRHLDFSYTSIQMLPKSIGSIYSLEALLLRGCRRLMELPQEIAMLNNLQYLDIRDTPSLRAIPSNSGNVKMPTWFVGGILKGPRLKELKHFMRLEGKLFISELQQVEQVRDTRDVRLCEKQGISELELKWAEEFDDSRNKVLENSILESFQPHINLKILKISYYGGTRFPPWLGSTLYTSIVHVALCGCHNVTSLPSLGQLPSLKELHINSLNLVTKIGNEFYGTKKPFPSLRTLQFNGMSTWENWFNCGGACEIEAPFICLEHLIIRDCPKLIGRLPRGLDSLTTLEIDSCLCLEESSHVFSLPSLKELYLRNCNLRILNSLVALTSLNTLGISTIPDLIFFERGFTKSLTKLERLMIQRCEKLMYLWRDDDEVQYHASLKSLSIKKCPRLASLMAMPPNLQDLQIVECDSLPHSEFESGRFPASLKSLKIKWCDERNFVGEGDWIYKTSRQCNNLRSLKLDGFSYLKELSVTHIFGMEYQWVEEISIRKCDNLRSLQLGGFSHLKKLFIMDCNTLEVECFPPIPITMSYFTLQNCANIKYLPNNLDQLTSLEALCIYNCENIRCFPEGHLPPNLNHFEVHDCRAFGVEFFPPLPIAISRFSLKRYPNIKYLPNNLHQLTSLKTLCIEQCGNIRCLPKGGLPLNLQLFDCRECRNMKTPIREWGLHRLTSLDVLVISGSIGGVGEKPCFTASADDDDEDDAWGFLPPSLTILIILDVTVGERLSSGLCSHLPSLRRLHIINCLKLRYFPKDGLPSSLEELYIKDCARLKERFSQPNGDYCHLIHEIPYIKIN